MANNTAQFHRVVKAAPEKLYRAFLEPDALSKWIPPYGFTCKSYQFEPKVGGRFKMSFTNFSTGKSNSFGGEFLELIPNEKIVHTDEFYEPVMPGVMQTTITLKPVSCGTELKIVQANIPEIIPIEFCYLGWQESLDQLIKLVEPNIPD